MRPPWGPNLIDHLFGILTIRWYAICILGGALLAAVLATFRVRQRGQDPAHVWNVLTWGMLGGVLCARLYYVAFEWDRYAGRSLLAIINPQSGGLAIHGALIGATITTLVYLRRERLPLLPWLDSCVPTLLVGQAIGRWGNFFNQEAYGRPTTLPWGLDIASESRIPPYADLSHYPLTTRFHPTFLYESLWNSGALSLILWLERYRPRWLKPGDSALWYGCLYSFGRGWIEGLRTDSLCVGAGVLDGSCTGGLRIAQLVSLVIAALCGLALAWRHRPGTASPLHPSTVAVPPH
ncbi:MAG TPA: prolipoprotein diacylglyceryl transferase [Herpetosiphonaceae bacterium]